MTKTFTRAVATRSSTMYAAALSVLLLLAACGGGGGGGAAPIVPVTVSIGDAQVLESDAGGTVVFPITLSAAAGGNILVNFATSDISASGKALCTDAGADYLATTSSITIPTGATSAAISITVCGDVGFEPNEKLRVTLTSIGANGVLGTPTATGVLVNDDAGGLNDTGASLCSNGATNAACPVATHPAQDAQSGRDANALTNSDADGHAGFSWTKLDGTGNALAIGAASWSCVRDNVTGLVWEAKTDDGGARDKDNTYTHANATAYVAGVNGVALCGYNDWRLPTMQELASQVDSGRSTGSLAEITAFPEQVAAAYWSGATAAADANAAWYTEFDGSLTSYQNKTGIAYARLVRSTVAPPATRFTAHNDGTLSDHQTGLMWRVCSEGLAGATCATGAAQSFTWQAGLQRAGTVNADKAGLGLGYDDWRLPNRNELVSIVDYSTRNPATYAGFVGVQAGTHWTSTPDIGNATRAWYVEFRDGYVAPTSQSEARYVLLVRDL